MPTTIFDCTFRDPNLLRRFGNKLTSAIDEVLLASRAYVEQSSEAQRSVVSTSAQDASGGTGAKRVRIDYLTSAYVLKTEDVVLTGTSAVNLVNTDLRFVERFYVIEGAAAAGAIKLMTTTNGGGSEFCGIGSGTYDAFLCHHYVPTGRAGYVYGYGVTSDDDVKVKILGRATYNGNIVDAHWDLVNLTGVTAGGLVAYEKKLLAVAFTEKAYIRLNVVPGQVGNTTIRGELIIWEV